jgi:hypothetical protein
MSEIYAGPMNLARTLERRIERLVEGMGSRVFPGRLHPLEVAIRLVREAELSLTQSGVGPTAPNHFTVTLNPADLGNDADQVVARLAVVVGEAACERGWRLEGPPAVTFHTNSDVPGGSVRVETEVRPGALEPWSKLVEIHGPRRLPVTKNRSLVGRSRRADIMLGDDSISRTHALLWFDAAGVWLQDLASSNGTTLNGTRITHATSVRDADAVGFGTARFIFRRA